MVVQPLGCQCSAGDGVISAWSAVEARQRAQADSYLLVSQPDHAHLSGELAAHFVSPRFPSWSKEVVDAIGVHDDGWSSMPGEFHGDPQLTADGKPRSFIEFTPQEFTRAWRGSIEKAASLSAVGGVIVSRHFTALAEFALKRVGVAEIERECLRAFLSAEKKRQDELRAKSGRSEAELDEALRALQFCDLLSLALCCEVHEEIEFPQCFGEHRARMRFSNGMYELMPSPFGTDSENGSFSVAARTYPGGRGRELRFHIR
jgi:hypothetical protein